MSYLFTHLSFLYMPVDILKRSGLHQLMFVLVSGGGTLVLAILLASRLLYRMHRE